MRELNDGIERVRGSEVRDSEVRDSEVRDSEVRDYSVFWGVYQYLIRISSSFQIHT